MRIKVARSARRHKVGKARIAAVMATEPVVSESGRGEVEYTWRAEVGGFVIEVVAVETSDDRNGEPILLVLHAMPMH